MFYFNYINTIEICIAAVFCVAGVYWSGGVGLGFWLTGKLGCAWVGAWVAARGGARVVVVWMMLWGRGKYTKKWC